MPFNFEPLAEHTIDSGRADLHNSEVNGSIAAHQLCGMTHLNTGRVCLLPERHTGGCDFSRPAV